MKTEWTGNVQDLVDRAARSDARETFIDVKTGAEIRINIDGLEGATERDEPFYIEYGDNLYDALNRREAAMILSNIRKGEKYPDMPSVPKPKRKRKPTTKPKRKSRRQSPPPSLGMMR